MAKAVKKEPVKLTVSQLLEDLKNGLDRPAIATKYGLTKVAVSRLFKHPKLKGKKTVKTDDGSFELEDDTVSGEAEQAEQTTAQSNAAALSETQNMVVETKPEEQGAPQQQTTPPIPEVKPSKGVW